MKPIQAGDRAIVINGLGQDRSPNLGLEVKVISLQGEHSGRGRIWRCEGQGIVQLTDAGTYVQTNSADFAASWLQKIEPNSNLKTKEKHYETT